MLFRSRFSLKGESAPYSPTPEPCREVEIDWTVIGMAVLVGFLLVIAGSVLRWGWLGGIKAAAGGALVVVILGLIGYIERSVE